MKQPVSKATRCHRAVAKEHRVWPFMYHCVDEDWQHTICKSLGVHFKQAVKVGSGRADLPLTHPNMRTIKKIKTDGNYMFRSLSGMVTGSQDQHRAIRLKVVAHMRDIGSLMMKHVSNCSSYSKCCSIDEYIDRSKIDQDGTWGSDIELLCFAHLCKTCVFSYSKEMGNWDRYGPHNVDRTITVCVCH